MRAEIASQGHTFTVDKTRVSHIPLKKLCGLVIPPDWRDRGKFDGGAQRELSLPSSFDWRDYGKVTPVQNQGSCGSCCTGCAKYHPMADWYYVGPSSGVASTTDIKDAIYTQGPIAVAVYVNSYFQNYSGSSCVYHYVWNGNTDKQWQIIQVQ